MRKLLLRINPLVWLVLAPAAMCAVSGIVRPNDWLPVSQGDLITHKVFAYRQWQYSGVKLMAGDSYTIRASGEWSYSPFVGTHGPEGGLWAPDWYPLTGNDDRALGGALLGRVGETGVPFLVGERFSGFAPEGGPLYLGINDDLLGDNEGVLDVMIYVTLAPTPEPQRD